MACSAIMCFLFDFTLCYHYYKDVDKASLLYNLKIYDIFDKFEWTCKIYKEREIQQIERYQKQSGNKAYNVIT